MRLIDPDADTKRALRPFRFPKGFMLIQDTREGLPLFEKGHELPEGLMVINRALKNGDYSIDGYEDLFSVERKQISDFYGYIGKERQSRTVGKMERFKDMISRGGWVGLAIEASEKDILSGFIMSQVPPEVARQALVSFEVRTGVHAYYSLVRKDMQRWILDRAIKFYKIMQEVETNVSKTKTAR